MMSRRKRPLGITVIALPLLWIGCVGSLLFPIFAFGEWKELKLFLAPYLHYAILSSGVAAFLILMWFGLYVLYAFLGVGLWRLRRWSWKTLVTVQVAAIPIGALMALEFAVSIKDWLLGAGFVVFCEAFTLLVLWYLNRLSVRSAFQIDAPGRWMSLLNSPSWWDRSSRPARIAIGAVVVLLIVAVFAGSLLAAVEGAFQTSGLYEMALKSAQDSPCVASRLGSPVVQKGFTSGSMSTSGSGDEGTAQLSIPVRGPKGAASLLLDAKKTEGKWEIQSLVLDRDGSYRQIVPVQPDGGCP